MPWRPFSGEVDPGFVLNYRRLGLELARDGNLAGARRLWKAALARTEDASLRRLLETYGTAP